MPSWAFAPDFRFYLYQTPIPNSGKNPTAWTAPRAFRLWSLIEVTASLVVSGQVGQMTASFADTDGSLRRNVNPQPMNQVQLWLPSRCPGTPPQASGPQVELLSRGLGTPSFTPTGPTPFTNLPAGWFPAWTGYVDTVEHTVTSQKGSIITLSCSTPHKLWDTTLQEEGNAFLNFSDAAMANVSGSTILEFSALQVNYPTTMLRIDPYADSGTGYSANALAQASWNPELQSWGAVMQAFLASAALEFFFDEEGHGIWRRVGFLGQRPSARQMVTDEIISATLATSDQGVYTDIEVRPQFGGATGVAAQAGVTGQTPLQALNDPQNAVGFWPARSLSSVNLQETEVMREHLGRRLFVAYAPWVTSNARGVADQLAKVLGYQAAAGVLHGQVTLVADPQFRVGSIILIPPLRQDPSPWIVDQRPLTDDLGTFYYVQSVTYSLTWGSAWFMTLGLAYGHSRQNDFPYLNLQDSQGQVNYPVYTLADTVNTHLMDAGFLTRDMLPYFSFTVQPATPGPNQPPGAPIIKGLRNNEVAADPAIFNDGTEVRLIMPDGNDIPGGLSHNGYYLLVTRQLVKNQDLSGQGMILYANVPDTIQDVRIVDPTGQAVLASVVSAATGSSSTGTGAGTDPTSYSDWGTPPGLTELTGYDISKTGTPLTFNNPTLNNTTTGVANSATTNPSQGISGTFSTAGATYTGQFTNKNLVPPTAPGIPGQALQFAYTRAPYQYYFGHAGEQYWDCSGLVAWSYHQLGIDGLIYLQGKNGYDYNTDLGPDLIRTYFLQRDAQTVSPEAAQPGDLLFIGTKHIAFSIGEGHNFGANGFGPNEGRFSYTIGEMSNDGMGFTDGIAMQTVNWSKVPGASLVGSQSTGAQAGQQVSNATGGSIAMQAYTLALSFSDAASRTKHWNDMDVAHTPNSVVHPGQIGSDGKRQFDCAGLVSWCYFQCGYNWNGGITEYPDKSTSYIGNADQLYTWLSRRPDVQQISVDETKVGDLIFCTGHHVGFCSAEGGFATGNIYGANNPTDGIGEFTIQSYSPRPDKALGMQTFLGGTAAAAAATSSSAPTGETLLTMDQIQSLIIASGNAAWGQGQGDDLFWIVEHESWTANPPGPEAVNPDGGACGLFQRLPCSAMTGNCGLSFKAVDVLCQIADGVDYVTKRYGNAASAKAHWEQNGSY